MADDLTLLQAILAAPDDNAPRFAYARYLSAKGDPIAKARAEFIELQIDIETIGSDNPDWPQAARRESELLEQFRASWERPFRAIIMPKLREPLKWLTARLFGKGGTWGFRRGFIEDISASVVGFMDADVHLFGLTPIQQVKLTNASAFVGQLSKVPELDGLRSLHLVSDAEFDEDMDMLLSNALEAGLLGVEVRVPKLLDGSVDLFLQLKGETLVPERKRNLDDFPAWMKATPKERTRMAQLANQPYFLHRLMEPDLGTEPELLRMNDWIFLGDAVANAKIWCVVKTYHDLEDTNGLCRRILLYKPDRVNMDSLKTIIDSPHFVREHKR